MSSREGFQGRCRSDSFPSSLYTRVPSFLLSQRQNMTNKIVLKHWSLKSTFDILPGFYCENESALYDPPAAVPHLLSSKTTSKQKRAISRAYIRSLQAATTTGLQKQVFTDDIASEIIWLKGGGNAMLCWVSLDTGASVNAIAESLAKALRMDYVGRDAPYPLLPFGNNPFGARGYVRGVRMRTEWWPLDSWIEADFYVVKDAEMPEGRSDMIYIGKPSIVQLGLLVKNRANRISTASLQ